MDVVILTVVSPGGKTRNPTQMTTMTKGIRPWQRPQWHFASHFHRKPGLGHQHLWPGHHLGHGPGPGTAGEGPSPLLGAESLQHRIPELLTSLRPNFVRSLPEKTTFTWELVLRTLLWSLLLGGAGRWRRSADPAAADAYRAAQRYAGDYAVPGSFQLTLQRDIYLYSRTTRVKRQTTQNGDSFHGGGSSTHRSSSGSSHGGSHGKF